jgi:DNA-binding NarL/FixJ family response regulator
LSSTNVIVIDSGQRGTDIVLAGLETECSVKVVGTADTVGEAIALAQLRKAALILSDVVVTAGTERDGLDLEHQRFDRVEIIVLGKHRLESGDSFATTLNRYVLQDCSWAELTAKLLEKSQSGK